MQHAQITAHGAASDFEAALAQYEATKAISENATELGEERALDDNSMDLEILLDTRAPNLRAMIRKFEIAMADFDRNLPHYASEALLADLKQIAGSGMETA